MFPTQITVREISNSPSIETHVREKAAKLTRHCKRIMSCRIVIDMAQKHKHQGKLFNVRIDVTVPGKELVVTKKSDEDLYVALRDAFHALGRQLEEHTCRRKGHVKSHDDIMHGKIARILEDEGYGFIEGMDGNEYYFSVTNVSYPRFEKLLIGDLVQYTPLPEGDGHKAHHVVRERNHQREREAA